MMRTAVPLFLATATVSHPAMASPMRTSKIGLISTAGCWWTVMTWRSWGRRYLFTEAGTVSVFGTSLIPAPAYRLDVSDEVGKARRRRGQERPDVVHDVRGTRRLFDHPPYDEGNRRISGEGFSVHVASHGRPDLSDLPENLC